MYINAAIVCVIQAKCLGKQGFQVEKRGIYILCIQVVNSNDINHCFFPLKYITYIRLTTYARLYLNIFFNLTNVLKSASDSCKSYRKLELLLLANQPFSCWTQKTPSLQEFVHPAQFLVISFCRRSIDVTLSRDSELPHVSCRRESVGCFHTCVWGRL